MYSAIFLFLVMVSLAFFIGSVVAAFIVFGWLHVFAAIGIITLSLAVMGLLKR